MLISVLIYSLPFILSVKFASHNLACYVVLKQLWHHFDSVKTLCCKFECGTIYPFVLGHPIINSYFGYQLSTRNEARQSSGAGKKLDSHSPSSTYNQ